MYYYLLKGNWEERLEELKQMAGKNKIQDFELWIPYDKSRNHHLIITYGRPLTKTYCLVKMVWKTSKEVFEFYYGRNRDHFTVHKGNCKEKEADTSIVPKIALLL